MGIQEKKHRLPKEFYKGRVSVAFTLCLKENTRLFINPDIITVFTDMLASVISKANCIVPVYCFMPEHQHVIIAGTSSDVDIWKTMVSYKQKTGFWLSENKPEVRWQKDFYDHVIRTHEDIAAQVRYILDNPVRKGLVSLWEDYPFKGSVGCNLDDVLNGIM